MPSNSNRMNKVDEELKKQIGTIISLELKDPHLTGMISVTNVKTSPDLRSAKVYVSMINEKSKKENLAILKRSSGFIRSRIAKIVNLRTTPELIFMFDDSLEYGSRIDAILQNLAKELKKDDNIEKPKDE